MKRRFVVRIESISDWYEDNSEVAYTFSRMPSSEAYSLLAEEHEQKMESTKWEEENLPKQVDVFLDRDEDDEIDMSSPDADYELIDMYRERIEEKCTDYVRYKMCTYDMLLPEGCDWCLVSCDGVVFIEPESEEGEDEGAKLP